MGKKRLKKSIGRRQVGIFKQKKPRDNGTTTRRKKPVFCLFKPSKNH